MDSGDDRYSTVGVGLDWTLIPGPVSALIDSQAIAIVPGAEQEQPAVRGAAYVGDLSRERGSGFVPSLIPARAPTSTASHPHEQQLVRGEASGEGNPPLLI